jgi:TolB-like protein
MKKTMLVMGMLGTIVASAHAQTADTRPGIAVLPFTNGAVQPELAPLSKGFQGMLTAELASNSRLRVVERDQLQRILDEQRMSAGGQVDPSTLVRVGKLVGARYMIYGSYLTTPSKDMAVTLLAFDTETGEYVFTDNSVKGKTEKLLELIAKSAAIANQKLNLPQLPAGSPAAREAAAKTENNKKMPLAAAVLYSRALEAQDAGKTAEAITLYKQVVDKFPFPPAQEAIARLSK